MRRFFTRVKANLFFWLFTAVFTFLFIIVLIYSRQETHLYLNRYHSDFLDTLMKYWTYLGDGIVALIIVVGLLLVRIRYALITLLAYVLSGLGAQGFKHAFFREFPRPVKYFELHHPDIDLHLVPEVDMYSWYSFPSGHTATAFALFFALALLTKSKGLQILLFVMALGVGYSRVYLSQHFLMDVVGGASLGMVFAWIAWWWIGRYENTWMDAPLINGLRKWL
ncbi:phosphatase PAP2 family protein [Bacteroidota bacterium]